MNEPKAKIIQPEGINYMIQSAFYTEDQAQKYINMLISKMEKYILLKKEGKRIAPLMTLNEMESQLKVMKQFYIINI